MDDVKKWTFYLAFLVAGFATGIGTIGLFPQFWLKYGITGLAVHVVFLGLFGYIALLETERVMNSGYYFVELFTKLLRKPALMLTFLLVIVMFLSYYSANVMLSLLSPILGTGTVGRLIAKLTMFIIMFLILTRAKEGTFKIMAAGSILLVVAILVTTVAFKLIIPENAAYLGLAKHMLLAKNGLSGEMIKDAALRALYGVGLGFAFYLMLGSFLNERFSPKLIVGSGILIQFVIGILSTVTVVYSIAPTTPARLLQYIYGGDEGAIKLMGELPQILSSYPVLLALIAISVFFAGLTSLLPTAEVGLQIVESMLRVSRDRAALYLISASIALGIFDSVPTVADMVLKAVSISMFFTAIYELYPVMVGESSPIHKGLSMLSVLLFAVGGVIAFYTYGKEGGVYIISAILAAVVILFGALGNSIFAEKSGGV